VIEWNLNGKSAQFGDTVPFTLVHIGKYRTEDNLKTDTTKLTKSQAVARIADRTAKNCKVHVT